jgi:hypothetical protein
VRSRNRRLREPDSLQQRQFSSLETKMKKIILTATLLMSASAAYAAAPGQVAKAAMSCCAALAACCGIDLPCC